MFAADRQQAGSYKARWALAAQRSQTQQVNPPAVGADHAEAEAADVGDFVALGQMAEGAHYQAADGVEFIIGKLAVEGLVQTVDRGQRLDQEVARGQRLDVAV